MREKEPIDEQFIKRGASFVSPDDINRVAYKADEIENKAKRNKKLKALMADLKVLLSMVKDYAKGNYRKVPYLTIATIVFSLAYVLNVLDFIPDFIPGVGIIDDVTVLTFTLKMVSKEIDAYRSWKVVAG